MQLGVCFPVIFSMSTVLDIEALMFKCYKLNFQLERNYIGAFWIFLLTPPANYVIM